MREADDANRTPLPSTLRAWLISIIQTVGWGVLVVLYMRTEAFGPNAGPWTWSALWGLPLIYAFAGGLAQLGGIAGMTFTLRAAQAINAGDAELAARRIRRAYRANAIGLGLQVALFVLFIWAIGNVHKGGCR